MANSTGLPEPISKGIYTPETILKEIEPPFPLPGVGYAGYARAPFRSENGWVLYRQFPFSLQQGSSSSGDNNYSLPIPGMVYVTSIAAHATCTSAVTVTVRGLFNGARSSGSDINEHYTELNVDTKFQEFKFDPPLQLGVATHIQFHAASINAGESIITTVSGYIEETDSLKWV